METTILVVDDDADILASVEALLADALASPARVLTSASAEHALALLEARAASAAAPVDVLVTDHHMARMTGWELATRAVRDGLARRAVLASGDHDVGALVHRAGGAAIAFLPKPFDPEALVLAARGLDHAPRASRAVASSRLA